MTGKADDLYRIYTIQPPNLDPDNPFPSTDCQHDDLNHLFFGRDKAEPGGSETGSERRKREHRAREVCRSCPFFVECALHGLEFEDYGVWGLTERDRRSLGGRGISQQGRPSTRPTLLRNLRRWGYADQKISELLARWDARRAELDDEREVA